MDFKKYVNTKPYPKHAIRKPQFQADTDALRDCNTKEILEFKKQELEIQQNLQKLYDESQAYYRKQREEWYAEENRIVEEFWKDAFVELGIDPNHPKAASLRRITWENGHAAGYADVFAEAANIAIFLKTEEK